MAALSVNGLKNCSIPSSPTTWRALLTNPLTRASSPGGGGGGGGGGGALGYLEGCIRSLSKLKNTPKALISGQKSTLILIKR